MKHLLLAFVLTLPAGCTNRPPIGNPNMVYRGPTYVQSEANSLDLNNLPIAH